LKTIKRANNLVSIHTDTCKCEEYHLDCFRAAVVLSISALDAYIRTLVVTKISEQVKDTRKPLSIKLKAYLMELFEKDALLEAGRKHELHEKIEKAVRTDFETKSFQGEHKINTYMAIVGYNDIFEEVSQSANKNNKKLRSDFEKFTARRHIIAHCGDFELNQTPHKENDINKEFAKECISIMQLFAEHINKITE
jgi:hypothetical protein